MSLLELNRGSLSGAAEWLASINFLHFAILLFALRGAVLVVVSLLTRPPDAARVAPLTVRCYRVDKTGAYPSRATDLALSAAPTSLVAAAWLFSRSRLGASTMRGALACDLLISRVSRGSSFG